MSRPLVISDCDEVILHMVAHFKEWLEHSQGVDFNLEGANFAQALTWLPGGGLVNHHGRLLLVGAIALSVLAARGARVLRERWGPRVVGLATALVLADLVLLAPGGGPLPLADPAPLGVVAGLGALSPGKLLVVPAGGPGVHFQRPLLDQRVHGRPLLLDPKHPGLPPALDATPTGRWLGGLALDRPSPPPAPFSLPGVAVLVVREPWVATVQAVLGPPDVQAVDSAAWDLDRPAG